MAKAPRLDNMTLATKVPVFCALFVQNKIRLLFQLSIIAFHDVFVESLGIVSRLIGPVHNQDILLLSSRKRTQPCCLIAVFFIALNVSTPTKKEFLDSSTTSNDELLRKTFFPSLTTPKSRPKDIKGGLPVARRILHAVTIPVSVLRKQKR